MSDSDLINLTVEELKEKLRERGLSRSGRKADLVSRLLEATQPGDEKKTNEELLEATQCGNEKKTNEKLLEATQPGNKKKTNEKLLEATQRGTEEKTNMDEMKNAADSMPGPSGESGHENSKNKADVKKNATGDDKDGEELSQKTCSGNCLPGDSVCPNRRFGKPRHQTISCHEVERLLAMLGVNPENASSCIKAAIMRGHIHINGEEGELDMVVHQEKGPWCGHMIQAKLGDLLRQPDYAGLDYEDGCQEATVVCDECDEDSDEGRTYVTMLCVGQGRLDSGKFHNHCQKCPAFGICIGDYRNSHCNQCGEHPFVGSMGQFGCQNCGNAEVSDDDDNECKHQ